MLKVFPIHLVLSAIPQEAILWSHLNRLATQWAVETTHILAMIKTTKYKSLWDVHTHALGCVLLFFWVQLLLSASGHNLLRTHPISSYVYLPSACLVWNAFLWQSQDLLLPEWYFLSDGRTWFTTGTLKEYGREHQMQLSLREQLWGLDEHL